jgi:hypothetical protein
MRKLASIQRISKLEPIEGADKIEKATVLGWELVVKKGEFKEGDLCVYCEIDSILPERPEFEFLRLRYTNIFEPGFYPRKFRIKTIKLRGQISQGICFPLSILPEFTTKNKLTFDNTEGLDVTEILGITKFEPYKDLKLAKQSGKISYPNWWPGLAQKFAHRFKFIKNYYRKHSGQKSFPSLIPKTDETRVQVLQPLLDKYKGYDCYITEKLDGSSITIYQINGKFGVCSRNVDLKRDKNCQYWNTVLEHNLENKFKKEFGKRNIALQGELIGVGVQGNKYKLDKLDIYFFNLYDIDNHCYENLYNLMLTCENLKEKTVPILSVDFVLNHSIPELVELSKGNSVLNYKIHREGIVIRPTLEYEDYDLHCQLVKNRVSFKVVNPDFLLKYD